MRLGALFILGVVGYAQPWATFLDDSRAMDWSTAGFTIPNYTVACTTQPTGMVPNDPSAAAANKTAIEAAIGSCDATHNVVNIPVGSFYVDGFWYKKNNVVVRGAGPLLTTILVVKGALCINTPNVGVCLAPSANETHGGGLQTRLTPPGGDRQCAWTGGLTKGSNPITISACGGSPPTVGTVIHLDQINDILDTNGVYVCDASTYPTRACSWQTTGNRKGRAVDPDTAQPNPTRSNAQLVKITAITGTGPWTVTLERPVLLTNIRAGQNPGIYWLALATRNGIEDLTFDHSAAVPATTPIGLFNCHECWITNVRSLKGGKAHFSLWHSSSAVVRSNYLFGSKASGSQSYGLELDITSSALVENNIFHQNTAPIMPGSGTGSVIAYNYNIDNVYGSGTNYASMLSNSMGHAVTNPLLLWEGNILNGVNCDGAMWGVTGQGTLFRNSIVGWQHDKSNSRVALHAGGRCRGVNAVGNVLGQPGHHLYYESYPYASGNVSDGFHQGSSESGKSVYNLGWTGLGGTGGCNSGNPPLPGYGDPGAECDTLVKATIMRWGNYDTVNAAVRWDAVEASPAAVPYINANFTASYFSSLSHALPVSLYRTTAPAFFPSTKAWPLIGPDITAGNVGMCSAGLYDGSRGTNTSQCTGGTLTSQWGNHVNSNPALDCFLALGGPPNGGDIHGGGTPLNYDANLCYNYILTTNGPLPNGTVSSPYSFTFTSTLSSPTWTGIALPPGLSVASSTGVLSGTPTTAGTYLLSVSATDGTTTTKKPFQLTVGASTGAAVAVTPGVVFARSVTASTTAGSGAITISGQPAGEQQFEVGQVLSVSGISGYLIVTSYTQSGNPATTSTTLQVIKDDRSAFVAGSSSSGLTVRLIADYLDHASVRLWATTDVNACGAVWFDTVSHADGASYQYRSSETSCNSNTPAIAVVGLAPSTRYHFRINAKITAGNDNSTACKTDACGAVDIAFTTPPDTHTSDGRPPMPTLPAAVATHVVNSPDTTAYTVISVPQFADGVVTGSITSGSTTLTVSSVPACSAGAGMCVGQWIIIAGTGCNFGGSPYCKITNIAGTTVTLNQAATATVSGAAVSWGMLSIQQLLEDKTYTYGTVFEFKQGYRGKWYATSWHAGNDGLRIPGLPLDDNASCSTHPCAITDAAHRWIVFRTATTPGKLPAAGVRTGLEYASALGGPEIQLAPGYSALAAFVLSEQGENSMPAHHVRFENMISTPPAMSSTAADPYPASNFVLLSYGQYTAQYIAVDRILMGSPDANTRVMGIQIAGNHIAVMNSYLKAEYWRPYTAHYGPDLATNANPSYSGPTITLPGFQWRRNIADTLVTQGNATITSSGTASGLVQIWVVAETAAGNGVQVRYTSGKGVTITCAACRAVTAMADPAPTASQKEVYYAEVASGTSVIADSNSASNAPSPWPNYFNDSRWVTEGPNGIFATEGHHWLISNNHIEGYNKGFFVDVPTLKVPGQNYIVRPPEHITIKRNHFYWDQAYRVTSGVSNGFNYGVRHCAAEFKRGMRILIEENEVEGCWAGINHGTAITISETSYEDPTNGKVEDFTVRYNTFHNIAESFAVNPHYVAVVPQMGADVGRVYFGHNLIYDQNAWRQHTFPANSVYGKQGLYCGHDIIVEHNTIYDAYSNLPIINGCGEDKMEGLWMVNNIWHVNASVDGGFGTARENTALDPIPPIVMSKYFVGADYDVGWASVVLRMGAGSVISNYVLQNNVFICGNQQNADGTGQGFASATDFDTAACADQQGKFGSLADVNFFVASPDFKSDRTAYMKWAAPTTFDYRWLAGAPYAGSVNSTDGLPMGADAFESERRRGVISNLQAVDPRATGTRGCASAAGTYCTTLIAAVPDRGISCRARYGLHATDQTTWTVSAADTATTPVRNFAVSGLAAGTYDYRILCAGSPPSATASLTVPVP